MCQRKTIAIGIVSLLLCHSWVQGQSFVDSVKAKLDFSKPTDSIYLKTCVKFCDSAVSTDYEFLIPNYVLKALQADSSIDDTKSIAALYDHLGNFFIRSTNLSEAAHQFDKMRLLGETRKDTHVLALSYKGLGTVYYMMSDFDKAREYYQNGISICVNDSALQSRFYNNIGNTFKMQNLIDSVWPYYNKAIAYHKSHQNYQQLSIGYCNMAVLYSSLRNFKETTRYLDLALETSIQANDPVRINVVYGIMGNLYFEQNPELSRQCYKKSLDLARKYHNYERIQNALINLSEHAEQSGNYKKALAYRKELKTLEDSLEHEKQKSRIRQIETDHIISLRNVEQLRNAQQQEVEAIRNENRQKILLVILSIAFVAILILFLMGLQTYRMKMKINRTRDKFFSMIAHDIKSPFSGILGLAEILDEHVENNEDPVHRKQMHTLHQSLNQVYDLLENLLQWSQTEAGKVTFNPSFQLLSPIVQEVIGLHMACGKQKGIHIENQIQSGLAARFDSKMLHTIIRNLLSNAIKFSPVNSTIFLSAEIKGKEVVVKVRDEGIGMDKYQINKILGTNERISTQGTHNETGTGLGLMLCKDFIAIHGGRLWIESKSQAGTTILFTLPD